MSYGVPEKGKGVIVPARDNEALVREARAAYNDHDCNWVASYDADDHEWVIVATGRPFWVLRVQSGT